MSAKWLNDQNRVHINTRYKVHKLQRTNCHPCAIQFLYLIAFLFSSSAIFAADNNAAEPNTNNSEVKPESCYTGILPRFLTDNLSGEHYILTYTIFRRVIDTKKQGNGDKRVDGAKRTDCDQFKFSVNKIDQTSGELKSIDKNHLPVFGKDGVIKSDGFSINKRRLFGTLFSQSESLTFPNLVLTPHDAVSTFSGDLTLNSDVRFKQRSNEGMLDGVFPTIDALPPKGASENGSQSLKKNSLLPVSDFPLDHHLLASPELTANGCWLLTPYGRYEIPILKSGSAESKCSGGKVLRPNCKTDSGFMLQGNHQTKPDCPETQVPQSGCLADSGFVLQKKQGLRISYLGSGPKQDNNEHICSTPTLVTNPVAGYLRTALGKTVKSFDFDLFDFHPDRRNVKPDTGKPFFIPANKLEDALASVSVDSLWKDSLQIENPLNVGVDYSAVSLKSDSLLLAYQTGFKSGSEQESELRGSLEIIGFKRHENAQEIDAEFILTLPKESCEFAEHWLSDLKFSKTGSHLYFLRNRDKGNIDSLRDPYVIEIHRLLDHLESSGVIGQRTGEGIERTVEAGIDCSQFVHRLTHDETFTHPIQFYEIDDDLDHMTIAFEEFGETVIRDFVMSMDGGAPRLIRENPRPIKGFGRIYDISISRYPDGKGLKEVYLLHSRLTKPDSLSRCIFPGGRMLCSGTDTPMLQNQYITCSEGDRGNQSASRPCPPKDPNQSLSPEESMEDCEMTPRSMELVSRDYHSAECNRKVTLENILVKRSVDPNASGIEIKDLEKPYIDNIHTFVLKPSSPNQRAVVSVHGGPKESWNGTFSRRDYELARMGYTVYMPNFIGSTGYSEDYTGLSRGNWGKLIISDILDTVMHAHAQCEPDAPAKEKCKVYLMGFSFGGYVVNLIQSKAGPIVLDGANFEDFDEILSGLISINGLFDVETFAETTDQFWFAEHEIGCSGDRCDRPGPSQSHTNTMLEEENPAFITGQTNLSNGMPSSRLGSKNKPSLHIHGTFDQRINFCKNVRPLYQAYKDAGSPFTLVLEPGRAHNFDRWSDGDQARLIHHWISALDIGDYSNGQLYLDTSTDDETKLGSGIEKWHPNLLTTNRIVPDSNNQFSLFEANVKNYHPCLSEHQPG